MASTRKALIVAIDSYDDAGLTRLASAAADAVALDEVLAAPDIGGFEVTVCRNEPHHVVEATVEDFFIGATSDEFLLVYFSGHGLKAETGELFLAASNTRPHRLGSSAIPASFIQQCMKTSRSRAVVLFLDCCYGGAFSQGTVVRASGSADVISSFSTESSASSGRGRAVITASSSMEYAFEGSRLVDTQAAPPSVFASALYQGLRTGDADRDEDGVISVGELYDWLYDRVREANPAQTPSRQFDLQGDLQIARSTRRKVRAAPLPPDLAAALNDASMFARIGALGELRHRLANPDLGIAMAALRALQKVAAHDIQQVAVVAQEILDGLTLVVDPPSLELDRTELGAANERVLHLSGLPLARAVALHSNAPEIWARAEGATVKVILAAAPPADEGSVITLEGPAGQVTVPVTIVGETAPSEPMIPVDETEPAPEPVPEPLPDRPPIPTPELARPGGHSRRTLVAAAAAALVLLAGVGIAWIARGDGLQLPSSRALPKDTLVFPVVRTKKNTDLLSLRVPESTSPTSVASTAPQAITDDGDSAVPAISPNRSTIIYRRSSTTNSVPSYSLWVMAANGSGKRPLFAENQKAAHLPFGGPNGHVAWSPDGRSIAAVSHGSTGDALYVVPLTTGIPLHLSDAGTMGDPSWSPDGREIVYWSNSAIKQSNGSLLQVSPDGKTEPAAFPLAEPGVSDKAPAWSPNGKQLAFCRGDSHLENIMVVDADGTGLRALTATGSGDCYPAWSPDSKRIAFYRRTDYRNVWVVDADGSQPAVGLANTHLGGQLSW